MILPHGGKLINRILSGEEEKKYIDGKSPIKSFIDLNPRDLSDLEMIATGGLSPLEGFMTSRDYFSVVNNMRLANGLPWTIPISLSVSKETADTFKEGDIVGLRALLKSTNENIPVGLIEVEEKFAYNKKETAYAVYGTEDISHPGVRKVLNEDGDILVGGKVYLFSSVWQRFLSEDVFKHYRIYPEQTRKIFSKKNWKKIVGFQTRNPIHRAHEYLIKCALEVSDGIFIHPIAGETKKDDIPLDIRMQC